MAGAHDFIAITGIGIHSPWGDTDATIAGLKTQKSAVRMGGLSQSPSFPETPGAPAAKFNVREFLKDRKLAKYMNQTTAMSVVAAGRALEDAGVRGDAEFCEELALFISVGMTVFDITSVGPAALKSRSDDGQLDLTRMGTEGLGACHPLMPFKSLLNMPLGLVSIAHGIKGHNFVTYPGVEQAGSSLSAAVRGLRAGRFEYVLTGGSSQGVSLMTLGTLMRRKLVASSVSGSLTYSDKHHGIAPGDASAFLMLEKLSTARESGRRVYAILDQVSCGRSFEGQARDRFASRAEHWKAVTGERSLDLLLSCGNVNTSDDIAEQQALEGLFKSSQIPRRSFDGAVGELGPAGLFFALGVSGQVMGDDDKSKILGEGRARHVLVSAGDVDGAHAAVTLKAWEGCHE